MDIAHQKEKTKASGQKRILMKTMTRSSLSGPVLLLLLLFLLLSSSTVSGLRSVVSKFYPHIKTPKTWHDAQTYCRSFYTDLAIVYQQSDGDRMSLDIYYAWIGLYRKANGVGIRDWTWTYGSSALFSAWATYSIQGEGDCAYFDYGSKKIQATTCTANNFFFCYNTTPEHCWYTFVPLSKTWAEAQQYCQTNAIDLISLNQINSLNSLGSRNFPVWIGLHREGGTWKWSSGWSDYRKWTDPPSDNGDCVSISSVQKEMATERCSDRFPFVCVSDNLLLVKERKTWEEALEHCRAYVSPTGSMRRYDLVSVQPGHDQDYIMTSVRKADTEEVWVGLRFLAGHWLWVTGADMLYSDLLQCPLDGKHCGALSKNTRTNVVTRNCAERKNFLCYRK